MFIDDDIVCKASIILIASACKVKSNRSREGLAGVAKLFYVSTFDSLKDQFFKLKPEMLLLDYELPGLNGVCGVSELMGLSSKTNIVVFYNQASEEVEWSLLKVGVRGYCPADTESHSLRMMVEAVSNGELWIRRKLLVRLLEQMEEEQGKSKAGAIEPSSATDSALNRLTAREYEIAIRVGSGGSNKQIANYLAITERTVKAHLTSIFNKLGVADRLNVALIVSRENSNSPQANK